MLSYERELKVNAHELYEFLLGLYLNEIQVNTGKEMNIDQLKNGLKYKYKKTIRKEEHEAAVHVQKPVPDHLVKSSFSCNGMHSEMSYLITAKDEDSCVLKYTQSTDNHKENAMEKMLFERNMKKRFKAIEKSISEKK